MFHSLLTVIFNFPNVGVANWKSSSLIKQKRFSINVAQSYFLVYYDQGWIIRLLTLNALNVR